VLSRGGKYFTLTVWLFLEGFYIVRWGGGSTVAGGVGGKGNTRTKSKGFDKEVGEGGLTHEGAN